MVLYSPPENKILTDESRIKEERVWPVGTAPEYTPSVFRVTCGSFSIAETGIRELVWAMTDGHCCHCGMLMNPFKDFSIDHKMPTSKGGKDCLWNLQPLCRRCNSAKGNRIPYEGWRPKQRWSLTSAGLIYMDRMFAIKEMCSCHEGLKPWAVQKQEWLDGEGEA